MHRLPKPSAQLLPHNLLLCTLCCPITHSHRVHIPLRFLERSFLPHIPGLLAPGGFLLFSTFLDMEGTRKWVHSVGWLVSCLVSLLSCLVPQMGSLGVCVGDPDNHECHPSLI